MQISIRTATSTCLIPSTEQSEIDFFKFLRSKFRGVARQHREPSNFRSLSAFISNSPMATPYKKEQPPAAALSLTNQNFIESASVQLALVRVGLVGIGRLCRSRADF